jgi:hypothetical protein
MKVTFHSMNRKRVSRSGIALIVTLIMLSVITFMTVTFLVLSQRERGSVTTSTDQLLAKQAAESAFERAKIELLAPMLAFTNSQLIDLIVSTNFINPAGFDSGPANTANNFTNVNFDYRLDGSALANLDRLSVLTNLLYNPRVPVYMTNRVLGRSEFRYYLDLNRNGQYDTNGWLPEIGLNGLLTGATNFYVGDPEWIGVLERPELPHSSSNRFLGRYAYLVVPSGKTLDINYIHNQAYTRTLTSVDDGFMRNQGGASWEINLGAFFTDLNWNTWTTNYEYRRPLLGNVGLGFEDALSVLRYRYAGAYGNLQPANQQFFNNAAGLQIDGVDQYSDGGLMTSNHLDEAFTPDPVSLPWAGSENPNQFYTIQELFDPTKVSGNFTNRLLRSGTNVSSYDRYTYYRLLEQLGTDSEPDRRMNLNYRNVDDAGRVVPGMETNLTRWMPIQFFTNAANRLIRAQFSDVSATYIPVMQGSNWVYPPVVNRLLQLAANMYESTTNADYPTLFRPYFSRSNDVVFISGFEEVTNPFLTGGNPFFQIPVDLREQPTAVTAVDSRLNIYGVPWIIGSRKGLPNINEIAAQSIFNITRRIQATRTSPSALPNSYQQEYMMDISSALGVEAWNSYRTNFGPAQVYVSGSFGFALTNNEGFAPLSRVVDFAPPALVTNNWAGYGPPNWPLASPPVAASFQIPLRTNFTIVPPSVYNRATRSFISTNRAQFEPITLTPVRWGLSMTNRVRVILCDNTGRVFDYVQLQGPSAYRDLSGEIQTSGNGFNGLWNTNLTTTTPILPQGINYQLQISLGTFPSTAADWNNNGVGPVTIGMKDAEIAAFRAFYYGSAQTYNGITAQNPTNRTWQVPFTPMRTVSLNTSWQANDPLVHYLADDLVDIARTIGPDLITPPGTVTNLLPNIGKLNDRYRPWGGNPVKTAGGTSTSSDPHALNPAVKDPLILTSDAWDFPTNKLANLGWLGRVHRGTPWQTVYLKSAEILNQAIYPTGPRDWQEWTGYFGATNAVPSTDRLIFDLFTVAPNENAGRGRLSVNQENLAAWSAVLSGVVVLTNGLTGQTTVIEPAAVSTNLPWIVNGINATRSNTNLLVGPVFRNGEFQKLGDILATPQLTDLSPFLPSTDPTRVAEFGIDDATMERIPQQVLSLLGHTKSPRFVIYSYGQSLRPAENSIVRTFGPFRGMCTNYQVMAETATRAVVRVEGSLQPGPDYPPRLVVEQFNVLPPD